MKRKRSSQNKSEVESDSSFLKSHPLFPLILRAINGEPFRDLTQQLFCGTNYRDPDQLTGILLDLLKLLERNSNVIRASELSRAVELQEQFPNGVFKSQVNGNSGYQPRCNVAEIEGNARKKIKLPPECISPVVLKKPRETTIPTKNTDFAANMLSEIIKSQRGELTLEKSPSLLEISRALATLESAQSQDLEAALEVKSYALEDETDDVLAHWLFPYVLRAINDSTATNLPYMPLLEEHRGSDNLVTAVLMDLLKLLEKRATEKRRVLDGIITVSSSIQAYYDVKSDVKAVIET